MSLSNNQNLIWKEMWLVIIGKHGIIEIKLCLRIE